MFETSRCRTYPDILSVFLSEMVFKWHNDQVVRDMADEAQDSLVSAGKNTSNRAGWIVGNRHHWEITQILCLLSSFQAGGPRGVGVPREHWMEEAYELRLRK